MREKGQTEVAKTLETPVFSRGIEILTEKSEFSNAISKPTMGLYINRKNMIIPGMSMTYRIQCCRT